MQCQVLYHTDGTKALQTKGFPDIQEAKEWMKKEMDNTYTQNARIVVDYAAIEAFQEMYDLMKNHVFGPNLNKRKEI
jgi:prophage maintenance system killer protein